MANLQTVTLTAGIPTAGDGTVSTIDALLATGLPIAAGGNTVAVKAASTAVAGADKALVVGLSPNTPALIYDGTNTITVKAASTTVVSTDKALVVGLHPNTPAKVWDGTNTAGVKAGSTTAVSSDPALVVALSPNGINPNGQASMSASAPVVIASDQTSIPIAGNVANAASDSGNPVKVGGVGKTANPTAVTDGQRVNATFDKLGKQVVVGSIRDLKGTSYASVATGSETTIVAGVASTFLDVYGCLIANNSATATQVTFKDSFTGTTRFAIYVPAGDTRGFIEPESAAYAQSTVNNAWTALCQPSVSALLITLQYVKNT